ncbi:MAG: phosphoglycerate dehydrogenase [Burkholderiales bacterium]
MGRHYRILTLNSISGAGLKRFPESRYTIGADISDPDAILVRSQDMHEMVIPASVRAVGRAGAGTNNIPVEKLSQRGAPVFNAPGANANAVKELVLAGILLAARNLLPALRFVEGLKPDHPALDTIVEQGKKQYAGIELPGHTLGVIGLGQIGSLVADAAIKLGMQVLGFDPELTVDAAWKLPSQVKKAHSIKEVLRGAEFVTLHVPLTSKTRGLINSECVHAMRHGVVLLNFARDAIVIEEAVRQGLNEQRIKVYVCDFPSPILLGHPQVLALPHLGASTRQAEENCALMVVDEVRDFLENGNILNSVNYPDVIMMRESPYRLGIANANVPNMVGQISTTMAAAGLNIHNMINKSRGEMAYTLVDVDSPVSPSVCERIAGISGVLSIRDLSLEAG